MSEIDKNAKAKLEAARRKAERLRQMQEQAARELAEAESLEAAQARERERLESKQEIEALHRATEKQRQRKIKMKKQAAIDARAAAVKSAPAAPASAALAPAASAATTAAQPVSDEDWDDDFEDDGSEEDSRESSKARRRRLGLHCFNCNRYEGHYLLYYRRLWYSYVIGMTFGLAIVIGPYRCQCCGSSRLMISNLLHPKYYLAVSRTRSKRRSSRR